MTTTDKALDARARRAAKRVGLIAERCRWRRDSIDNNGGFLLRDPSSNIPVAGSRWSMSAEEVINYCRSE